MRKPMSFRLQFQTIDMLDSLVQLVTARRKREAKNGWTPKIDRTHVLHVAIDRMFREEQKLAKGK